MNSATNMKLSDAMKDELRTATVQHNGHVVVGVLHSATRKALVARGATPIENLGIYLSLDFALTIAACRSMDEQSDESKGWATRSIMSELAQYGYVDTGVSSAHDAICWSHVRAGRLVAAKHDTFSFGIKCKGYRFTAVA